MWLYSLSQLYCYFLFLVISSDVVMLCYCKYFIPLQNVSMEVLWTLSVSTCLGLIILLSVMTLQTKVLAVMVFNREPELKMQTSTSMFKL